VNSALEVSDAGRYRYSSTYPDFPAMFEGEEVGVILEVEGGFRAYIRPAVPGGAPWWGPEKVFQSTAIDDLETELMNRGVIPVRTLGGRS
jgi:hypothetical protein